MSKARELAELGAVYDSGALSNRNVIINGAMQVAQRGTQTNSTNAYTACDRWEFIEGGSSVITSSQDSDSPQGFADSLKLDVTTASGTPSAGDYAIVRTKLEGQDLQNLLYGTSSAKQITISFSVKSPKAGTHYVELIHNSAGAMNSIAYTVNSANTWENKVVTFDGYQPTALNNNANSGLLIYFWLMAGSNYTSGTHSSNTWHTTNANRAAGQVNAMDNTSNNFYLTGVQLEVGTEATPFEHRSFGDELRRCQRYYQAFTLPSYTRLTVGYCDVNTRSVGVVPLSVPLRALNSTGHTNLTVEGNAVTSIGLTLVNCQLSGSFVIGSGALTVGDMEQVYTVGAGSFYAEGEL